MEHRALYIAAIMCLAGSIAVGYKALSMDVTVHVPEMAAQGTEYVANLQLMHNQELMAFGALALFLASIILAGAAAIVHTLVTRLIP